MACTTLLVGKHASYDGSTIIVRNEDCEAGTFNPKELEVVEPADQPRSYTSTIGHLTLELPGDPVRYLYAPNVDRSEGIWGEAGVNAWGVGMSATETITTNARVLGADPLVPYVPAKGAEGEEGYVPAVPGGLGEEDLVTVVLPYIKSAREGVKRLGALLEEHGTYETNGIAFSDKDEVWYLESIGGHHWIARRVPDDCYVTMPNQLGIDAFDLADAYGEGREHLCSADLADWMRENRLDVSMDEGETVRGVPRFFNPRLCFGSHGWRDEIYNTPRAWYMQRCLNPSDRWDGPDARFKPESEDIPWCRKPEHRVTIEDVKAIEGSHYQGTPYDPYNSCGNATEPGRFRPIGINRTCEASMIAIDGSKPAALAPVMWVGFGDGSFNTYVPVRPFVRSVPAYLQTGMTPTTDQLYWANRLIAAIADPHYLACASAIEGYVQDTLGAGLALVKAADKRLLDSGLDLEDVTDDALCAQLEAANEETCALMREKTDALLDSVLFTSSNAMTDRYSLNDH